MGRDSMANFFDISKRSVINIIEKLELLWLVEKDPRTKNLRTTQLRYEKVIEKNSSAKIAPSEWKWSAKIAPPSANNAPKGANNAPKGAKIAPYSNNNIIVKEIVKDYIFFSDLIKDLFIAYILDRMEKKEKITESTISFWYKRLQKIWKSEDEQREILETTIANWRKGIFPLKTRGNNAQANQNWVYKDKKYDTDWIDKSKVLSVDIL